MAWEQRLGWIKSSTETLDRIDGEPMEFEWNIFPGFNTLQLSEEVKFTEQIGRNTRKIQKKNHIMSMSNDIYCGSKDNEKECLANAKLVSLYATRFWKRTKDIHFSWF